MGSDQGDNHLISVRLIDYGIDREVELDDCYPHVHLQEKELDFCFEAFVKCQPFVKFDFETFSAAFQETGIIETKATFNIRDISARNMGIGKPIACADGSNVQFAAFVEKYYTVKSLQTVSPQNSPIQPPISRENHPENSSCNSTFVRSVNMSSQTIGGEQVPCESVFQKGEKYRVLVTAVKLLKSSAPLKTLVPTRNGDERREMLLHVVKLDELEDINAMVQEAMKQSTEPFGPAV